MYLGFYLTIRDYPKFDFTIADIFPSNYLYNRRDAIEYIYENSKYSFFFYLNKKKLDPLFFF